MEDVLVELRKLIRIEDMQSRDAALQKEDRDQFFKRMEYLVWEGNLLSDNKASNFTKWAHPGGLIIRPWPIVVSR